MKLTPLKINLLLHIYAIAAPFNHPEGIAWQDGKRDLLDANLIDIQNKSSCGYEMTDRGRKFVEMILDTPMPVLQYIDPRTGGVV